MSKQTWWQGGGGRDGVDKEQVLGSGLFAQHPAPGVQLCLMIKPVSPDDGFYTPVAHSECFTNIGQPSLTNYVFCMNKFTKRLHTLKVHTLCIITHGV